MERRKHEGADHIILHGRGKEQEFRQQRFHVTARISGTLFEPQREVMIDAVHLFRFVHLHPVTSEVKVNCRVVRLDDECTRNPFSGPLLLSELNQQAGAEDYRERVMGCNTAFFSIRFNA